MEIFCREQHISVDGLSNGEKTHFVADGQERNLGMQLSMNTDCDKYSTLIKGYDRKYLSGNNKYPKTLHDAYNLVKRWNKYKPVGQNYPSTVGISFKKRGQ